MVLHDIEEYVPLEKLSMDRSTNICSINYCVLFLSIHRIEYDYLRLTLFSEK